MSFCSCCELFICCEFCFCFEFFPLLWVFNFILLWLLYVVMSFLCCCEFSILLCCEFLLLLRFSCELFILLGRFSFGVEIVANIIFWLMRKYAWLNWVEEVVHRYSSKWVFLQILQIFTGKNLCWSLFSIKLQAWLVTYKHCYVWLIILIFKNVRHEIKHIGKSSIQSLYFKN